MATKKKTKADKAVVERIVTDWLEDIELDEDLYNVGIVLDRILTEAEAFMNEEAIEYLKTLLKRKVEEVLGVLE